MSGLSNLVRVHQWILEEKRQQLAELVHILDGFKDDLEVLEHNLACERHEAARTLDGALAYQTVIAGMLERRRKLRNTIANLERDVEAARDEVGAALQELKKYERAHEAQLRHEDDQRRREQGALDELGLRRSRRGRAIGDS